LEERSADPSYGFEIENGATLRGQTRGGGNFSALPGGAAASVPFAVREQLLTASRFPTELRQDLGYAIDRVGSADAALKAVADNELLTTSVFLA
jgi:hypothetical protein